jgi:SulP family sulfate permease
MRTRRAVAQGAGVGNETSFPGRFVPALSWVPAYKASWLPKDAIAGFTLWGLLVPEGIAYASLAGLAPQAGLYTLLASLVLYAVFGTSKQLVVAGTSASAVLLYSSISALHPKNASSYAALAGALVILTGILFVASGLFRLGFVTQFLSGPVMEGFVTGLAIFIMVSQLPKLFGLSKGPGDTIRQFGQVVAHLGSTSLTTFAVGAVALALLFALDRVRRVPGGLVVLVLALIVSTALDLHAHGVKTVGRVPAGLPAGQAPDFTSLWTLLPSAAGMMLVIFSEALAAAGTFADRHGYRLDPSQDMIALGLANIGSGLLGGLAAGGSMSQSAVNDAAGARSEMSPVVAAVLSLVTVLVLTPLFTNLPEAVLAAMIIHAVSHLLKVAELRRFYRLARREFWLGMITLLGVITLDVLPGLLIGVVLSLLVLAYRASRPYFSVMGVERGVPGVYEDVRRHSAARQVPGVLIVRPDAPLFYANAQPLRDTVTGLAESGLAGSGPGKVHTVILDLDGNDEIDITAAEALDKLAGDLRRRNVRVVLAHVHAPVGEMLRRSGVAAEAGGLPEFRNLDSAVRWASSATVPGQPADQVPAPAPKGHGGGSM